VKFIDMEGALSPIVKPVELPFAATTVIASDVRASRH
jgi:hypothetical protein